jgi:hypothetical protein
MKQKLDKFIKETPALVLIILLPVILWTIIFLIQLGIGHFMPPMLTGAIAGISGVLIGTYVRKIKDN